MENRQSTPNPSPYRMLPSLKKSNDEIPVMIPVAKKRIRKKKV